MVYGCEGDLIVGGILNKLEGQGRPIIISSEVKLPTLVLLKHTVCTTELFTSVLTLAKQNVCSR